MKTESRSLELAEKVLCLKNFKLKALCKKAVSLAMAIGRFDPRDNGSMREALWCLSDEELGELLKQI